MFDTVKLFDAELRELLGGQPPLVAVPCEVAFGADRLERTPEEIERLFRYLPRNVREQAVEQLHAEPGAPQGWSKAFDKVIDAFSGDLIKGDPDERIGGVSAAGHVGSWAHQLSQVLEKASMPYCVVSTGRLVFADHEVKGPFHQLASLPREAVLHARRAGRFMQRGRVVLDFGDMSALALRTGLVFTGHARRLVSVLGGGMLREGDEGRAS